MTASDVGPHTRRRSMVFKKSRKRVVWWESDGGVSGAAEARVRGHADAHRGDHLPASPYYGPVVLAPAHGDAATEAAEHPLG